MIAKLHFSLTLLLSFIIFYLLEGYVEAIIISIIIASFSTFPDLDIKINSFLNKILSFLEKLDKIKIFIPIKKFFYYLSVLFTHRGITHSIFFSLFFIFLSIILQIKILIYVGIAVIFHILEDMTTVSGVKPFYPLSDYSISLGILNNNEHRDIQMKISKFLTYLYIALIIAIPLMTI